MSSIFEETNVHKAIMGAGLPAMLGQLTTLIYNIADTYFVAMTNDPDKIAAVTLCAPVLLIVMSIACIFGAGGSSIMARLLGMDRKKEAAAVSNFCFYGMLFTSIITMVLGLIFEEPLAAAVGADADNMRWTRDYLRFIFLGTPFNMLANGLIHMFRSAGLIRQSTIGLMMGNGLNIVFDFIFIVIFQMGTMGAALATSMGFFFATIYYLVCMTRENHRGNNIFDRQLAHFHPTGSMIREVFSVGIPGALVTVLISVSNIVLNNFLKVYGSDSVASYGIASKIYMIAIMLSVGLAQGVGPLVGYHYGAGHKKMMHQITRRTMVYGVIMGLVLTMLFFTASRPLAGIFMNGNEELLEQTAYFLRVLGVAAGTLGIANMTTAYFQALGKGLQSLILTLLRNVAIFIPAVMVLDYFLGLNGVIGAQPVAEVLTCILSLVVYGMDCRKQKKEA